MSITVQQWVWDHAPASDAELLLLLAMADHAHDDGGGVFPAVPKLAKRIRKSERHTQRMIQSPMKQGLIERTGQLQDHRYIYRIALPPGDIAMSPGVVSQPRHRGVTSDVTGGGDIAMTPKPSREPPLNLTPPTPPKNGHWCHATEGRMLSWSKK